MANILVGSKLLGVGSDILRPGAGAQFRVWMGVRKIGVINHYLYKGM